MDWLYTEAILIETENRKTRITGIEQLKAIVFGDGFFSPECQEAVYNQFVDTLITAKSPAYYASVIYIY